MLEPDFRYGLMHHVQRVAPPPGGKYCPIAPLIAANGLRGRGKNSTRFWRRGSSFWRVFEMAAVRADKASAGVSGHSWLTVPSGRVYRYCSALQ
jgi:hypothetical protein